MRLSVIVPVYNTERYLSHCIDSILDQSFTDFELLLVDDGSTDGSEKICDAYAEKDNRVCVLHKENGGVSSARNLGIDNAKGEWVIFVDSDDWIDENYLQLPYEKEVDLFCQQRRFSDGTYDGILPIGIYKGQKLYDYLIENSNSSLFRMTHSFFFKKAIVDKGKIRFDERLRFGEDRIFTLNYYKYCRSLQVMDTSYYVYNRCDNWDNKYNISFHEAELFVDLFMNCYRDLPFQSPSIVLLAMFVERYIDCDEKNLRWKMALSKPIMKCRKALFPIKDLRFKIRYYISKMLSVFIHV